MAGVEDLKCRGESKGTSFIPGVGGPDAVLWPSKYAAYTKSRNSVLDLLPSDLSGKSPSTSDVTGGSLGSLPKGISAIS